MARVPASIMALIAVGSAVVGEAALAQDKAPARPNQILIEYVDPKDESHRLTYQRLKERRVLEQFQEFLSPIRLPVPLTLKYMGCDGDSNAWYEAVNNAHSVTVCYEYIEELITNAPKHTTPDGVSHQDAILGPAIEVVLHEVGHALFAMLKLPILGRGEDAADQFAAYKLLHLGKEEAYKTIAGVAYMYTHDAKEEKSAGALNFADEHGLAIQRYYNLLCIAYGSDPVTFQKFVDKKHLPPGRAKRCAGEYQQVVFAIRTLLAPHIDQDLARQVEAHQHWTKLALD